MSVGQYTVGFIAAVVAVGIEYGLGHPQVLPTLLALAVTALLHNAFRK